MGNTNDELRVRGHRQTIRGRANKVHRRAKDTDRCKVRLMGVYRESRVITSSMGNGWRRITDTSQTPTWKPVLEAIGNPVRAKELLGLTTPCFTRSAGLRIPASIQRCELSIPGVFQAETDEALHQEFAIHEKCQRFQAKEVSRPTKHVLLHVFHHVAAKVPDTWRIERRKEEVGGADMPEIVSASFGRLLQRVEDPILDGGLHITTTDVGPADPHTLCRRIDCQACK